MATASAILDDAQAYLHDSGAVWSRTELLGYLNHGYMQLLKETEAIRRLAAYDTPARVFWVVTFPWERQHAPAGHREWSLNVEIKTHYRASYRWEGEHLLWATPTASANTTTQYWERLYSGGEVEHNDRYTYPAHAIGTARITYNGIRLWPTSVRELDDYAANWANTSGGPFWYTPGLGTTGEFEIWPQVTAYTQTVHLKGMLGTIRQAGTYTVATTAPGNVVDGRSLVTRGLWALGALGKRLLTRGLFGIGMRTTYTPADYSVSPDGYGIPRRFAGTVQYVVENMENPGAPVVGIPRRWTGSDGTLLVDYAVGAPTLTEADSPSLLPAPFAKYLRYYILARALARDGEGYNPKLASHYEARFKMGLELLQRISFMAATARTYQNAKPVARTRMPLRPRLPAEYPRVR